MTRVQETVSSALKQRFEMKLLAELKELKDSQWRDRKLEQGASVLVKSVY